MKQREQRNKDYWGKSLKSLKRRKRDERNKTMDCSSFFFCFVFLINKGNITGNISEKEIIEHCKRTVLCLLVHKKTDKISKVGIPIF